MKTIYLLGFSVEKSKWVPHSAFPTADEAALALENRKSLLSAWHWEMRQIKLYESLKEAQESGR